MNKPARQRTFSFVAGIASGATMETTISIHVPFQVKSLDFSASYLHDTNVATAQQILLVKSNLIGMTNVLGLASPRFVASPIRHVFDQGRAIQGNYRITYTDENNTPAIASADLNIGITLVFHEDIDSRPQ